MTSANRTQWMRCVIVVGFLYAVIGISFALPSNQQFWRLAAWAVSGVIYLLHIGYEQLRLRNSRLATSVHAALAAALGGFLLAVGALVHAATVPAHAPYRLFLIAMIAWPIITGVPALVVALVVTFVLDKLPHSA
jgi:hypothetical protein